MSKPFPVKRAVPVKFLAHFLIIYWLINWLITFFYDHTWMKRLQPGLCLPRIQSHLIINEPVASGIQLSKSNTLLLWT